jgi:hypothetical protein
MTTLDEQYRYRDQLTAALVRDLIGPNRGESPTEEESLLSEPPVQRYITGVLFPISAESIDAEHDIDIADDDDDVAADPPVAFANVRSPSSMAITFAVDPKLSETVSVEVGAARYEPEGEGNFRDRKWRRNAIGPAKQMIDVTKPVIDQRHSIAAGLELFWRVRPADHHGNVTVTVGLINRLDVPADARLRDEFCFFQPWLHVSTDNGEPAFVDRSGRGTSVDDADVRAYRLLYRHIGNFAVGHGCSVDWTQVADTPPAASEIWSTFTPVHDLALSDSNPQIASEWFGMQKLSEADRGEAIKGLRGFAADYEAWIEAVAAEAAGLTGELADTAAEHLKACKVAASRIHAGIDHLADDDLAWTAFQLMNRAMQLQRARSIWVADPAAGLDEDSINHQWRPFQLGFILLSLGGLVDPDTDDRRLVDLLWFPTGGGKTEAYLGLIAFTIFLRRLRGDRDGTPAGGMTVIMRYTLRLLTLQQFERATALICACERLRRSRDDLGEQEISICLWVGKDATPNTHAETRKALSTLSATGELQSGNPVQLHRCPWCGTRLSHANYWLTQSDPRLMIACKNTDCDFEKGIPAYVVDEDVYRRRPSLMIATVDKFASLPWRESVEALFNHDHPEPPPELIVQDELHLISGPLGTLVGLYETAIDMLCQDDRGIGPKVIASTATIRGSDEQVRGLYATGRAQFPPPGIDGRDSYFAVEVPPERKANRRYLGLMAPATSHTSLLVRTYAALLEYVAEFDASSIVRDPYWTLVGYFNSLRVLGGALLQVRDDVPDRMQVLASRQGPGMDARIQDPQLIELTSRESSASIPGHLARMALDMDDPDALDVILATNMISVGVDIDRLGLMAVMGQPQSTSEYIQSTSRVGRRHPGLIAVLFNSARSRDRSHYESFKSFHSALYRQVDATSVTPFSARARDRALHAVLIGMLRTAKPKYRPNKAAADVSTLREDAAPFIDLISDRVAAVMSDEADATRAHLKDIVDEWIRRAEEESGLVFSNPKQMNLSLLGAAGEADRVGIFEGFPTLWSLRDVDTTSNLYLIRS